MRNLTVRTRAGSADIVGEFRGFAVKFITREGNSKFPHRIHITDLSIDCLFRYANIEKVGGLFRWDPVELLTVCADIFNFADNPVFNNQICAT